MPQPTKEQWFVYLLECANGRLYTGITTDMKRRFHQHCSGKGAMFTRLNAPSHMLGATPCADRSAASKLEWRIKQLTPQQKRDAASRWPSLQDMPQSQR